MAKSYLRYPDNWIVGTRELSLDERGAYCDLLDLYISRDGILPDDKRKRSYDLACDPRTWRRVRQSLIDAGKIEIVDGNIVPTSAQATLQQCHDRSEKARVAAENRWRKARLNPPAKALAKGLKLKLEQESDQDNPLISIETTDAIAMPIKTRHKNKKTPPSGGQKKRGTRLPEEWQPSDTEYQFACNLIGATKTHDQINRFKDYWAGSVGRGGTKLDWPATWRNWVRRSIEFDNAAGNNGRKSASITTSIRDAIAGGTDGQGLHADRIHFDDSNPNPGPPGCDNDPGRIIDAVASRRSGEGIDPPQGDDQVEEHGTGGTVDDDVSLCG